MNSVGQADFSAVLILFFHQCWSGLIDEKESPETARRLQELDTVTTKVTSSHSRIDPESKMVLKRHKKVVGDMSTKKGVTTTTSTTSTATRIFWSTTGTFAVGVFAIIIGIVLRHHHHHSRPQMDVILAEGPSSSSWNMSVVDPALAEGSEQCTIQRMREAEMTPERFAAEFWRQRPVILVREPGTNSVAQRRTKKEELLHKFGDRMIPLAKLESYAFRDEQVGSLKEYITNMTSPLAGLPTNNSRFAFSSDQYGIGRVYNIPNVMKDISNLMDPSFQLAIAGSGTGLAFHWHADVFAETLHGERRWFLFPPDVSPEFNPRRTSAEWVRHVRPRTVVQAAVNASSSLEGFQECTLKPNEAIYVPADWFHSTLSLGEAVSITTSYASTYRRDRYLIEQGLADNVRMLDAFASHDFKTASHYAEQLIHHRPNNFVPYSWLGVILTLNAKERHVASLEDFQTALQAAHDATLRCIELNPLFCPCHVWLSRQLMGLSVTYKGIDSSKEQMLVTHAKVHRQIAENLSAVDDDEMLDPRWQPKYMNRAQE